MDMGRAKLGMTVAEIFRRNRKMTSTTSPRVSSRVYSTSRTDSRMGMRAVVEDVERHGGGQLVLEGGQQSLDGVGDLDGVGAGLALDGQDDGPLGAVGVDIPGGHLVVFHAVGDGGDVAQADGRAVAIGDDQRAVFFGVY